MTSELSESVGSNSNISKELGGIQPKTIRRSLNWQNIPVEAPSRGNGMSLPGGIQRQQEEPGAVIGSRVAADSVQKSAVEPGKDPADPAKDPWNSRDPGLSDRATEALKRLENLKKDPVGDVNSQANHNHYSAARREAAGEIVAKRSDARPYSHIGDLQRACDGLYNVRDALEADLRNPPDTITSRGIDVLDAKFREIQILINRLNGFLSSIGHGNFPPYHEWKPGSTPGTWTP